MSFNREEKMAVVRKIVDKLSGTSDTQITTIGMFNTDISEVNFITKDPCGLIKGFVKQPYYNDEICAYLADSAHFNAKGKPEAEPIIVSVFHYKDFLGGSETEEKQRTPLKRKLEEVRLSVSVADLISMLVARNEVLRLPNLEFDEKWNIFEVVVHLMKEEEPHLTINSNGTGDIRTDSKTIVIFE